MSYSSEVLADSPTWYSHVDETSGTNVDDATANNRDGTYVGSPSLAQTSLLPTGGGTAVALNGTSQRITVAHNTAFNIPAGELFSFECWVKLDDPTQATLQVIGDKTNLSTSNSQWVVYWDNRNVGAGTVLNLRFRYHNASGAILDWQGTTARDALAAGGHLVATTDATTIKLYWNGSQVATSSSAAGSPSSTSQTLSFGAKSDGTGNWLDGTLDEIAIYQSTLSAARVLAHYNAAQVPANVAAPLLTLTLDTLAPGVPVPAPVLALTLDTLAPAITTPPVAAPLLSLTLDTLAPAVVVAAPLLTLSLDTHAPTLPGAVINAPLLTLVLDTLAPGVITTPLTLSFAAAPNLSLASTVATSLKLAFGAQPKLNLFLSRPHTVDPVTGLPQYRLQAMLADGTVLGEIPNAQIGDIVEELGLDGTRLDFTLPKYDRQNALVLPVEGSPVPEVQVWRGPSMLTWQKVDGARPTPTQVDYDCSGLAGYLDGRLIGKFPKTDWLVNGAFGNGMQGWTFGYDPGSVPATQPNREVVEVDFFGVKAMALKLSGADTYEMTKQDVQTAAVFAPNSATYLSGGEAILVAAAAGIPAGTDVHIVGHTAYNYLDGDYGDGLALSLDRAQAARTSLAAAYPTLTFSLLPGLASPNHNDGVVAGRGRYEPLNDNSTYAEQAVNRRVTFSYATVVTADADSAQYAKGSLTVGGGTYTNTLGRPLAVTFFGWALLTNFLSTSKTGYGVYVTLAKASAPTIIIEEAHSTLDENTPTDDWVRHEATVTIPPDGIAYVVTVRYYAPGGDVLWTHGGVYPEEALYFPSGTDRALVVKGLVEHAQDATLDKEGDTPILIGTKTPLTGRLTKATYPYHERRKVLDAVNEHAAVKHGVDLRLGHSSTERWVETHYPRLGTVTGVTFELGSNVVAYDSPIDVATAGTRWVAQALESSGADREEGVHTDLSGLGGVLLERLAYAEPGTAVTELQGAAESASDRYGHPLAVITVTVGRIGRHDPALTSWMLDHVNVGDYVNVDIVDGPIVHTGQHRVIRRTLTPDTDTLRYALFPEVA